MAETYVTIDQAAQYLSMNVADISVAQIHQAELDTDLVIGYHGKSDETTGLTLNPTNLSPSQRVVLQRAVSEQIKYRIKMGNDFFDRPEYQEASVEGMTVKGALPKYSPRGKSILAKAGLIRRVGNITGRRISGDGVLAYLDLEEMWEDI